MDDDRAGSRRQIENLIYRVAELRDTGDFDGMAELFAHATFRTLYPGTTASHGVQFGQDQVAEGFRTMVRLHDGSPRTKYLTTNVRVEIDDANAFATARSYYLVLQATERLPLQVISAGRYVDQFANVHGQWHFTDRSIIADFSGELSEHLAVPPAEYGERFNAGVRHE
jgi:3-phenylpropionate/cinnamic acid dioxygenase small subunit